MVELLETSLGGFKSRIQQYMGLSEEVNIVTGYVSIEGLERLLLSMDGVEKIRVLVGVRDYQYERLEEILKREDKRGKRYIGGIDSYSYLRKKVSDGSIEIELSKSLKGYRIIHSKGYLFRLRDGSVYSICGSNNLTVGGLEANKEWSMGTSHIGVYVSMYESFRIDWLVSTQEKREKPLGEYRVKILEVGVGETRVGREYIEFVIEYEDGYIDIQRINKNQGYKASIVEEMEILSGMEGMPMEDVVRGCIGERVKIEINSRGQLEKIEEIN